MNERQLYYYDAACEDDAADMDKELSELRSIGTRSRSKNKRPPIVSLQIYDKMEQSPLTKNDEN